MSEKRLQILLKGDKRFNATKEKIKRITGSPTASIELKNREHFKVSGRWHVHARAIINSSALDPYSQRSGQGFEILQVIKRINLLLGRYYAKISR